MSEFDVFTTEEEKYRFEEYMTDLQHYPFLHGEELGQSLSRFNGAVRIDITKEDGVIKNPRRFLTILRLMELESSVKPSHALKIQGTNRPEYIPIVLELNPQSFVGVFYFDSSRTLLVPQIHSAERLIKQANMRGGIVIANHIGMPAKKEAERINNIHGGYGILTIEQYGTVQKRYEESFGPY